MNYENPGESKFDWAKTLDHKNQRKKNIQPKRLRRVVAETDRQTDRREIHNMNEPLWLSSSLTHCTNWGLQSGDATPGLELNALLWVGSTHMNSCFWTQSWNTFAQEKESSSSDTTHTHTQTHREERNRDYSANRGREKKERERKKARKKVAWEALLQGKDKAPCFRQQNHMTHSLQTHPTL